MVENTKRRIIETFLNLTTSMSVQKISIARLMRDMKLQRETYYYYFNDKYALIEASLAMLLFDSYDQLINDRSLDTANRAVLAQIKAHPNFFNDLLSNQNEYMFKRLYCQTSLAAINRYLDANFRQVPETVRFAGKFYIYAVNNVVYEWVQSGMKTDPEALVRQFSLSIPVALVPYFKTTQEIEEKS
ncbi:TetR/AcrR family transcriptional regulator C-terminal domain-containing protein [Furfurilactobacillus curtus]|uniref:HTH tetR-type domain-containing protein n=1 Tax=Furfurilactobacillus curtus TaxID=1746200 RepID=A0ABQ5JPY5_9LACO